MLFASILLMLISLFLFKEKVHSCTLSVVIALTVFALLLFSGFWWMSDYFTGQGIDELVIYHLRTDLSGAGLAEFKYHLIFGLLYIVSILLISVYSYKVVRVKFSVEQKKLQSFGALIALIAAVVIHPALGDANRVVTNQLAEGTSIVPELFHNYEIDESSALNKKNIIYIYLESVEATYLDEDIFPNLMPNISQYRKNALSFDDIRQVYGDGWTIGGMVSSQCGMPLVTASQGNSMSGIDRFLPEAVCLGDILIKNGYILEYYGGASLDFAGKGNFYRTHGFDGVYGLEELKNQIDPHSELSSWGLHDDDLFNIVSQRAKKLLDGNEPFGLFALTLDTHHPNGHVSQTCENLKYRDGSNPILNAVHCADNLLFDLIKKIQKFDTTNNTLIVVSSDHLAMPNTASQFLKLGDRRNLLFILNSGLDDQVIEKPGALYDIAPTLLDLLGSNQTELGFGRSLLREASTLLEQKPDPRAWLASNRAFISPLWGFPTIQNGLTVNLEKRQVDLNGRSLRYPALLIMDEKLNTEKIYFQHYSPKRVFEYLSDVNVSTRFLWIDSCDKKTLLQQEFDSTNGDCISYGKFGHDDMVIQSLSYDQRISFDDIRLATNSRSKSASNKDNFHERLQFASKHGVITHDSYTPSQSLHGDFLFQSAGGVENGPTFVVNLHNNMRVDLARGLTLVGLNVNSGSVVLKSFDTCGRAIAEITEENYSFQDDISKYSSFFGAFAILAHDSAVCVAQDFSNLFRRTGLKKWNQIGYRTPYVGVIAGNGEVMEYAADAEGLVSVRLSEFNRSGVTNVQAAVDHLPAVAHAGGGYKGQTYTNSIEALDYNSRAYNFFEIDFSWTSDGHLVCIHDWDHSFKRSFGLEPQGPVSLSRFIALNKSNSSVEKCTIYTLAEWLRRNPHARIVTDVKENNVGALDFIARTFPDLQQRFIPQVYQPSEYFYLKHLNYKDVIWTLYRFGGSDDAVLSNLHAMNLLGLTMPRARALRGLAERARAETGVLTYVHTINSEDEFAKFRSLGVSQIYTDFLPQPLPFTHGYQH